MKGRGSILAIGLVVAFCLCFHYSKGQALVDTLHNVQVIGVHPMQSGDARIGQYTPGIRKQFFDSLTLQRYQQQNMVSLLSQQTPVFVKSYGFNNLATLTFRGASAAQSAVLWNGIPLQNAALGIADISTLPVSMTDKIGIIYGSSASLLGSGNVGGALLLEDDKPRFDSILSSRLQATIGGGSYRQYQASIKGKWYSRNWYAVLRLSGQSAQNDFSYTDEYGEKQKLSNAHLKSGSGSVEVARRLGQYQVLSVTTWLQTYHREIPPALFESSSLKKQNDAAARLLAQWQYQRSAAAAYIKTAYFRDLLSYNDSAIRLYSRLVTHQVYGEAGWSYQWKNQSVLLFAPVQYAFMPAQGIDTFHSQLKVAVAAAYRLSLVHERLQLSGSLRDEAADSRNHLLPGANASFRLLPQLVLRANVQRTYRLPTLNELYYNPGGNPNLLPESGWHQDAGYQLSLHKNAWSFTHDAAVFNRDIHNWIIWYGGAIWTPHNIATVHSRGLETDNKLSWQGNSWRLSLAGNVAYTLATTTQSTVVGDNSIGKQIPYMPKLSGQGSITVQYKSVLLQYDHSFTGLRYATVDESQSVDAYNTGNIYLSWQTAVKHQALSFFLQGNNIWNRHYEVVAYRPMPGFNFLCGVTCFIKN